MVLLLAYALLAFWPGLLYNAGKGLFVAVEVPVPVPVPAGAGDFLCAFIGLHQLRFGALEHPAHFADILALRLVHAALPVADGGLVNVQLLGKVDLQKPRLFTVCSNCHFSTSKPHKNELSY